MEKDRETSIYEKFIDHLPPVCPSHGWDQTFNLGTCLDWELNPWPSGAQDDATTKSTEPHQPGHTSSLLIKPLHIS